MNTQPISKQDLSEDGSLAVHHLFSTIQGEGPFAGVPSIFIRLAGCNLRCPLCDTDYTTSDEFLSPGQVVDRVQRMEPWRKGRLVVLSGGEPFRQNIAPLVKLLIACGYRVQVETNGTLFVPGLPTWDENLTIVCSPKTGKLAADLVPHIKAMKYVLHADDVDPEDGLPTRALGHPAHPRIARPWDGYAGVVYVQPCDTGDESDNWRHRNAAIRSCLKYGYTLCLQLHKLINME